MTYIQHITLTTGHTTRQRREAVTDAAIFAVMDILDGALQGGIMAIPGRPGYLFSAAHVGRGLVSTIWRCPVEERVPVLTMGTVIHSRGAAPLWRMLHEDSSLPVATDPQAPPRAPWQADRLEIGALEWPEAMSWTGDFSRCLAWAWLEY